MKVFGLWCPLRYLDNVAGSSAGRLKTENLAFFQGHLAAYDLNYLSVDKTVSLKKDDVYLEIS